MLPAGLKIDSEDMNATRIQIGESSSVAAQVVASPGRTASGNTKIPTRVPQKTYRSKRIKLSFAISTAALLLVAMGLRWWGYLQTWESTDNAYVSGHVHTISSRIAGNVLDVLVNDNQEVVAGEVLALLDTRDFEVRRVQAHALVSQADAQIAQAKAQVAREEAILARAERDFHRAEELIHAASGAISQQEFDNDKAAFETAKASLAATEAASTAALAQREVAAANLADAELQLSYTKIVAPATGRIGRKNVEKGNHVQPGQALLALVQPEIWVTANFKETQLRRLHAGQSVRLDIDGFPGQDFFGKVESISPASGAEFALLPPDNATGNFTKIVQRVPVKIVFDSKSLQAPGVGIVPGMSVVARVRVRS